MHLTLITIREARQSNPHEPLLAKMHKQTVHQEPPPAHPFFYITDSLGLYARENLPAPETKNPESSQTAFKTKPSQVIPKQP